MDPVIPFEKIAAQAISLGASLVGAVPVAALLDSDAHGLQPLDHSARGACSVIVLALAHARGQPEMDWWDNQQGRTPGNRLLIDINRRLANWFREAYATKAAPLPYAASRKGIFLKDAAVLSGLGVMGKNNLLITPQYGPRVRLRALLLNRSVQGQEPLDGFAPCDGCDARCRQACPREAFRGGAYQRNHCMLQLKINETHRIVSRQQLVGMPATFKIAYCRLCELSCPVGQ